MLDPTTVPASRLMKTGLVCFREDTPVQEAVLTLEDCHITGAPVVNERGECVGVFSVADVLKRRRGIDEGETPRAGDYFESDPFSEDPDETFSRDDYDEEVLGKDTVGQWMTAEVKSVTPDAPVEEICRRMVREQIHRLLVMDGRKLKGMVTTFDIVSLVAGLDEPAAGPALQEVSKRSRGRRRRR